MTGLLGSGKKLRSCIEEIGGLRPEEEVVGTAAAESSLPLPFLEAVENVFFTVNDLPRNFGVCDIAAAAWSWGIFLCCFEFGL
jgi:ribonucleotide reductase alpha subunit